MKKFGVCGHFGDKNNCTDGQTIKTRIFAKHLKLLYGEDQVVTMNTISWKRRIVGLLKETMTMIKNCENIVILPSWNGVKVFIPLFLFLNKFYHRKVHYLIIGGWIPGLLKEKPGLLKKIKKLDGLYAETEVMIKALNELGVEKVYLTPNCKELDIADGSEKTEFNEPYPLCVFSRVSALKGIGEACTAVEYVNKTLGRCVFSLDIYGTVDKSYEEEFFAMEKNFPSYIKYMGAASYKGTGELLKEYFGMLFPTRAPGEGYPGSVLDAYAAGVPVIATEWNSAHEIIKHGVTGLVIDFSLENQILEKTLMKIAENPEHFTNMRRACLNEAKKYQATDVVGKFAETVLGKENL
ncbi:MAG: glycosyltransferase [Ruminococcaceae bacterium]|nr:glycosyltransferase [Oscillospiraceae bacterium]